MRIKYVEISSLLIFIGLSGCSTVSQPVNQPSSALSHDNMDSTIWVQTSPEYAAVTTSVYAAATNALRRIATSNSQSVDNLSVVLDIDETVLDNSRYQGQLVKEDERYGSDSWDRWVSLRDASAVPGAVEFVRTSQSLGFQVVFITNRKCRPRPGETEVCPQKLDTLVNLKKVGVSTESTILFLRGEQPPQACRTLLSVEESAEGIWSRDKTSRRRCTKLAHPIALLLGDQLGDFTQVEDRSTYSSGHDLAERFKQNWGENWFMLPNPTYGDWRPSEASEKRTLLRGID